MIGIIHTRLYTSTARQAIKFAIDCGLMNAYEPVLSAMDRYEHPIASVVLSDLKTCPFKSRIIGAYTPGDFIDNMDCIRGLDNEVLVIYHSNDFITKYTEGETNTFIKDYVIRTLRALTIQLSRTIYDPNKPFFIIQQSAGIKNLRQYLESYRLHQDNPFESMDRDEIKQDLLTLKKMRAVTHNLKNRAEDLEDAIRDPIIIESRRTVLKSFTDSFFTLNDLIVNHLKLSTGYLGSIISLVDRLDRANDQIRAELLEHNQDEATKIEEYFSSESHQSLLETIKLLKTDTMLKLPCLSFILAHIRWYKLIV